MCQGGCAQASKHGRLMSCQHCYPIAQHHTSTLMQYTSLVHPGLQDDRAPCKHAEHAAAMQVLPAPSNKHIQSHRHGFQEPRYFPRRVFHVGTCASPASTNRAEPETRWLCASIKTWPTDELSALLPHGAAPHQHTDAAYKPCAPWSAGRSSAVQARRACSSNASATCPLKQAYPEPQTSQHKLCGLCQQDDRAPCSKKTTQQPCKPWVLPF
jgi:hypothetical protein